MAFKNKESEILYKARYYQENKERLDILNKSRNRDWRIKNTNKLRIISSDYYWDHKESVLKYQKEYRKSNFNQLSKKDKDKTKSLCDGYMRKHLLKLGYTRQQIRKYPELLLTHKFIILTKRL